MSPAALPGGGFPLGGKALGAGDGSISRASACLAGRAILVTRPAHQSAALADLIARDGGEAVLFPTIDILPATDPRPLAQAVAARDGIGLAIFTSANAVTLTLPALLAAGGLPPDAGAAAIGEGTAAALVSFGVTNVVIPPTGADTESLLEHPELAAVAGRRIVIFTGEGGRRLLADALAGRGATVVTVPCYRRERPASDPAHLERRLAAGDIAAVTAASGEALLNLFQMVGEPAREVLRRTPVFVAHERIAGTARSLGFGCARVCGSGDRATIAGMVDHFASVATQGNPA